MSTKLTDPEIITATWRVLSAEQPHADAVEALRELLPPTVATNDDMYDAFKAGYDLGYAKAEAGR